MADGIEVSSTHQRLISNQIAVELDIVLARIQSDLLCTRVQISPKIYFSRSQLILRISLAESQPVISIGATVRAKSDLGNIIVPIRNQNRRLRAVAVH